MDTQIVMIVTYHWPPDLAVGAIRPQRIAEQLKLRGWHPIILTVTRSGTFPRSEFWKNTVTNDRFEVIRTRSFPSLRNCYLSIKRIALPFRKKSSTVTESEDRGPTEYGTRPPGEQWWEKLRRVLLSLLWVPDEHLGWMVPAATCALKVVHARNVQGIISTGPPQTTHLISGLVSKLCGIPHIVDFRDPWIGNDQKPWHVQSSIASAIDRWLEQLVVVNAKKVICVTPEMSNEYRLRYSSLREDNFETVSNGYDRTECPPRTDKAVSSRFTIRYLGSLSYTRSPITFLNALLQIKRHDESLLNNIRVEFIGLCRYSKGISVKELIDERGLSEIVKLIDVLPRHEAIRLMQEAHSLLLLAPDQTMQIPGKFYEYLATGQFMIVETELDSATARVVRETNSGCVVPIGNVSLMAEAIEENFRRYRSAEGKVPQNDDSKRCHYDWNYLGQKYHRVLIDALAVKDLKSIDI